MKFVAAVLTAAVVAAIEPPAGLASRGIVQFVFTSDAHYGLYRTSFRGERHVSARTVNRALVAAIDSLRDASFPADDGISAGAPVGSIDFLMEGGDVANRSEIVDGVPVQPAAVSWSQFRADYDGLKLHDRDGRRTPLHVIPGNHDASNAIGFYKSMAPSPDPSSLIGVYNLMMQPQARLTAATFRYDEARVHAARDFGGVHFVFLHVWPDSSGRAWMRQDLARVPASTPVVLFAHDPPESDPRHFVNPNGAHDVNATDGFENLLSDRFADGATTSAGTLVEQTVLEEFFVAHPNINAYFHGHNNFNQFYDWTGPYHSVAVHAFRVDSPMKGALSKNDETKLSFQIATIDIASRTMTVREVLWNAHPDRPSLTWGESTTVVLSPRLDPEGAAPFSDPGGESK